MSTTNDHSRLIDVRNITKSYDMGESTYHALKGVSFTIDKGDMVAIVGPSGCGKSTTMHILGLLGKPTTGEYYINGTEVGRLSSDEMAVLRNLEIGFIFQSFFLLPKLSVIQNVSLPLLYRGAGKKEAYTQAREHLDQVGVGEFAARKPSELSGGQQQRVAIARSLIGKPNIILGDEPTGALDTKTSAEVMRLLKQLNEEQGVTIVLVTHDLKVAAQCPRNLRVRDGLLEI